jgi:hypothetical protein
VLFRNDELRPARRARGAAAALLLGLTIVASACTQPSNTGSPQRRPEDPPGTAGDGTPVFPVPKDTAEAVRRAQLGQGPEVTVVHYHAHLDVIINGHPVTVPANIGISTDVRDRLSPLHTHDTTGIIHVESDKQDEVFRVGQLFTEWGVKLDKNCIDIYCNDDTNQLLGFVDGQMVGDASSIPFKSHQEIVVWYGPRGSNPTVPATYEWTGQYAA